MDHTPEEAGSMELPKEDGVEQRTRDGAHLQIAQDAKYDAEGEECSSLFLTSICCGKRTITDQMGCLRWKRMPEV